MTDVKQAARAFGVPEWEAEAVFDGRRGADELAARMEGRRFGHIVVCPVCDEVSETVRRAIYSVPREGPLGSVLVVLVVNARRDAPEEVHRANAATLKDLEEDLGEAVLVIDHASEGRRPSVLGGVGFARRVGASLACALRRADVLASRFVHNLDADSRMHPRAFEIASAHESVGWSALFYAPRYAPEQLEAACAAEIVGRIGNLGMRWARSPYAVEPGTPGLAFSIDAYEAVGGWEPTRGGEDFDLANRLLRHGPALRVNEAPVTIEIRASSRTLGGTGDNVRNVRAYMEEHGGLRFQKPLAYDTLAMLLDVLDGSHLGTAAREYHVPIAVADLVVKTFGPAHAPGGGSPHVLFDFYGTVALLLWPELRRGEFMSVAEFCNSHPAWHGVGLSEMDDLDTTRRKLAALMTTRYVGPCGGGVRDESVSTPGVASCAVGSE